MAAFILRNHLNSPSSSRLFLPFSEQVRSWKVLLQCCIQLAQIKFMEKWKERYPIKLLVDC